MKKIAILLAFSFLFASATLAYQETTQPTAKKPAKPKVTVDCTKVDDASLTTSVKEKLANTASLKGFTINVSVKDGVVTLTGTVKKPTNKGLATSQTKRVPCVKKVDNQITVEAKPAEEKKSKT
jgi:osmotically-inducible protein OsmY